MGTTFSNRATEAKKSAEVAKITADFAPPKIVMPPPNPEAKAIVYPGFEGEGEYDNFLKNIDIDRIISNTSEPEMRQALRENWEIFKQYATYIPSRLYTSHPINDMALELKDTITCFKVARLMSNGILSTNVVALVHLDVNIKNTHFKNGQTGAAILNSGYLYAREEYCVGEAIVSGIQLMGNHDPVGKVLDMLQGGLARVVANHDPQFEYRLGHLLKEPEHGQPGRGCVKGIHLYADSESAIRYSGKGFFGFQIITPVISSRMTVPIESDVDVHPAASQYVTYRANASAFDDVRVMIASMVPDSKATPPAETVNALFGPYYAKHNNRVTVDERRYPAFVIHVDDIEMRPDEHKDIPVIHPSKSVTLPDVINMGNSIGERVVIRRKVLRDRQPIVPVEPITPQRTDADSSSFAHVEPMSGITNPEAQHLVSSVPGTPHVGMSIDDGL
jgi:hypothetical protein